MNEKNLKSEETVVGYYPVIIHRIETREDEPYYMAFLPDFGEAACSAVGETIEETLEELGHVKEEVIAYYLSKGKPLPKPSRLPSESQTLQQMPIRVPQHMHDELKACASREGLSLNTFAIKIFTEHLTLRSVAGKIDAMVEQCIAPGFTRELHGTMQKVEFPHPRKFQENPPQQWGKTQLKVVSGGYGGS